MEKVRLSKSAIVKANENGREYAEAYLFVRTLHRFVTHPILFRFKSQMTALRHLMGMTDKKFRQTTNAAISLRLASYNKGTDTLTFLSNNADRKIAGRCDYINTDDPQKTFEQIVIRNYYYKQKAALFAKQKQTSKSRTPKCVFDEQKKAAPDSIQRENHDITLSCRAAAKLFNRNSPASGTAIKLRLTKAGLINVQPNKVEILKQAAVFLIKQGKPNIRRDKTTDKWYYVLADTFDIGNKQKKQIEFTKGTYSYCNNDCIG